MSEMNLLCSCSISELSEGLSLKKISPEQIIRSHLDRIEARDSEVRGWAYLDPATSISTAKAYSFDGPQGPFHGIPFAVKDVFEVESTPRSYGSTMFASEISKRSSSVVEKLRDAGGICLGKTVTAEFALYKPGKTRNPNNIGHTPGGSSSGSAATVADYQVPLALGTQTAGSIIRPASYCGVIGFKPTLGRYSRAGVLETSPTLDTIGFFCRTATDALLVDRVLAEREEEVSPTGAASPNFTVGIYQHQNIGEASSVVRAVMELAENKFTKKIFDSKTVKPNSRFLELNNIHRIVHAFEARRCLLSLEGFRIDKVSNLTREFLEAAQSISELEYDEAVGRLSEMRQRCLELFDGCDVLIAPAAPDYAPRGLDGTGDPVFNRMWTALGVPCAAFPMIEFPGSLPLGLQLIGRLGEDQKLLEILKLITS